MNQGMSALYTRYQAKRRGREQGTLEKNEMLYLDRKQKQCVEFEDEMYRWHCELIKKIEGAANAYQKCPCVEHASKLIEAIYA